MSVQILVAVAPSEAKALTMAVSALRVYVCPVTLNFFSNPANFITYQRFVKIWFFKLSYFFFF
jgi:hypothetical protein